MVSTFARFSPSAVSRPHNISGNECASGTRLEAACAQSGAGPATQDTKDLYGGQYVHLDIAGTCKSCSQSEFMGDACRVQIQSRQRG
jgi:hypothetical protein